MKRFIVGLVVGIVLALSVTGFASYQEISIYINGNKIETDVPPQIIDGRTMVPIRFVAEAFGAKVDWDGENRNVLINFADKGEAIEGTRNDLLSLNEIAEEYAHYDLMPSSDGNIYIGEFGGEILFNWMEEGIIINGRGYVSRDLVERYLSGLEKTEPDSEPKTVRLGETISRSGIEVRISRIEQDDSFLNVFFSVRNNSDEPLQRAGMFSFRLSPQQYEEEFNRSGYGHQVDNLGYVYPGESSEGYYQWHIESFSERISIEAITYHIPLSGIKGKALGTWVP